jgi:glycosyltransferase involved in cell wall biosynthesis
LHSSSKRSPLHIAFIGSVGIPNLYGGFEAFLEHTTPFMLGGADSVMVTCAKNMYPDGAPLYNGVERVFIACPANGAASILHDLLAFFAVFGRASHIIVLGVSGGMWFPLFRLLCSLTGKHLYVNVDGVEWKRGKFSAGKRLLLRALDYLAQRFAHQVIIDSDALIPLYPEKTLCIAYPGDHVLRVGGPMAPRTALTVCRIEPENNIAMLIEGVLASAHHSYTIIGNWQRSPYGVALRAQYGQHPRLTLLDPIYDADALARHRDSCSSYVHGHSVGGTNPSLVEMLYYDCQIYCLDVPYHHATAGRHARFFDTANALAALLDAEQGAPAPRDDVRAKYSRDGISAAYLAMCAAQRR